MIMIQACNTDLLAIFLHSHSHLSGIRLRISYTLRYLKLFLEFIVKAK
jgi:hypothetical protein